MPLESVRLRCLLSYILVGRDMVYEGAGMWRCCGISRRAGHSFSVTEREHWRLSMEREEEATFLEHPLGVLAFQR